MPGESRFWPNSRESQCSSRFSVKKRQGDSDRMGIESSSVQSDLPLLASTNDRFVCNKIESQASNVCVFCPDSQAWETDALNISWDGQDGYVFCPVALIPQVIQKMTTYRCRIIMIAPAWPGMSWFWDLVILSTNSL